jgi:hypothetical protein
MSNTCLQCEEELVRRELENNYHFAKRQYCSQICYRKYMKSNRLGWYSHNNQPLTSTFTNVQFAMSCTT